MRATAKKKLCWNCEGNVSKEADNCPYCGVYLHPLGDHDRYADDDDEEEKVTEPPYRYESTSQDNREIPAPPYAIQEPVAQVQAAVLSSDDLKESNPSDEIKKVVVPLLFLLIGANFLLFGIILFLFSTHGVLTLHWDANYWFAYIGASIPLFLLGWKTLK